MRSSVDDRPGLSAGAVRIEREDASFGDDAARIVPVPFGIAGDFRHHLADFARGERHGRHEEPASAVLFQFFGQEPIVGFAFDLEAEFASGDETGEHRETIRSVDLEHEGAVADQQRPEQGEEGKCAQGQQ